MTRHLLEVGHRRIAFVCGPADSFDACERLGGYRDALVSVADAGSEWLLEGTFDELSGYRAGQMLAQGERPGAVFAANDMMALGCLFALRQAGLRVPHDIAVAGFDDVPMARWVSPGLTTLHVEIASLGTRALQLLLQQLGLSDGASPLQDMVALAPRLVIRQSSVMRQ